MSINMSHQNSETHKSSAAGIPATLFALLNNQAANTMFYIAFAMVYFRMFFRTTMFFDTVKNVWIRRLIDWPSYGAFAVLGGLAGLRILEYLWMAIGFDALNLTSSKEIEQPGPAGEQHHGEQRIAWIKLLLSAITLIAGFLCWRNSDNKDPFILCCLCIAVINRPFYPALMLSTVIGSVFMVVAYLASMNGIIPYLVYNRGEEVLAHAFGLCYRTDFAAHVLFLVLSYAVLRREKLHLWEYLMLWVDTWIVWRYSAARMNSACLALFLILLGILHIFRIHKHRWPHIPAWTAGIHIFCLIFVIVMIKYYPASGINSSLNARVRLSLAGFEKYPLNLFGHLVEEQGAGRVVQSGSPYFFLDVSYVRILLLYGVSMMLIYLALMTSASHKAAKANHAVLVLALLIVAANGIIEHHATELGYNVFLLAGTGLIDPVNCHQSQKQNIGDNQI